MVFCSVAFCGSADDAWYTDSFIHAHVSVPFSADWQDEFEKQVCTVRPDVIEVHASTHSSWPHIQLAESLARRMGCRLALTINRAGSWREAYDDDDRFVYRVNADGTRAGRWGRKHLCCNAPAVDAVTIPYYASAAGEFQPSQIWIDENVIAVNLCYCEHCGRFYRQQHCRPPPLEKCAADWDQWVAFHRSCFVRWMKKVVTAVSAQSPHTLITFNHAFFVEQPERPPGFVRNLSADIHHDPMMIGLYARYGAASGLPFDIMPGLGADAWAGVQPKTVSQIKQDVAIITANGGRWNIGEFPTTTRHPRRGTPKDVRRPIGQYLRLAREGAEFARRRQLWTQHTQSVPYVAVLHSATTHYDQVLPIASAPGPVNVNGDFVATSEGTIVTNAPGEACTRIYWPGNKPVRDSIVGAHLALLENHVHHDVINEDTLLERLDDYQLLVVADQHKLSPESIRRITEFVAGGGVLIATARTLYAGLHGLVGCIPIGEIRHCNHSFAWEGQRVQTSKLVPINAAHAQVLCYVDPEEDNSPVVTLHRYGKGIVSYVAVDLFRLHYLGSPLGRGTRQDDCATRKFTANLLEKVWPHRSINVSAPPWWEIVVNSKRQSLLVHLVDRSTHWGATKVNRGWEDAISIAMQLNSEPYSVMLRPDGKLSDYTWQAGRLHLSVSTEEIDTHAIVEIVKRSPAAD